MSQLINLRKIKLVTTLFITAQFIAGCATQEQKPLTVVVPVVVSKPALPERPRLAIADINSQSSYDEVFKYYAMSVKQLTSYSEQLENMCK